MGTVDTYVKPRGRGHRMPSLVPLDSRFGRLVACAEFDLRPRPDGRARAFQRFLCDCGLTVWLRPYTVKNGNTASCGCLHSEQVSDRMTSHGATKDRQSDEWRAYRAGLQHQRRARAHDTTADPVLPADYDRVLAEYDRRCWICDCTLGSIQWDHYQPLARGGAHTVTNLRPACQPCNSRKGAIWPFTDDLKNKIAAEVRALRSSQSTACSVVDGEEVNDACQWGQ